MRRMFQVDVDIEDEDEQIEFMDSVLEQWKTEYPLAANITYIIVDGVIILSYDDLGENK
jgi:hypothetical protein